MGERENIASGLPKVDHRVEDLKVKGAIWIDGFLYKQEQTLTNL